MRFYGHVLTEWIGQEGKPLASLLAWGINPSGEAGYCHLWFSDEEVALLAGPQREQEIAKKFFEATLYFAPNDEGEGLWYHWICPRCGEVVSLIDPDIEPHCGPDGTQTWEQVLRWTRIYASSRLQSYHQLSARSQTLDKRFPSYSYPLPE